MDTNTTGAPLRKHKANPGTTALHLLAVTTRVGDARKGPADVNTIGVNTKGLMVWQARGSVNLVKAAMVIAVTGN